MGKETIVEKISNRQLMYILFIMRATPAIAFLPALTAGDALQDAWISVLLTFVVTSVILFIIGGLGIRFPDKTVVQFSQELLRKWPGRLVCLIYLWAFLWTAAVDARMYAEVLITGFLTETPLSFIVSAMVFAATFAAYGGIEVIGRAADFIAPLFILAILLTLASLIPNAFWDWLQPVFARGIGPILRSSITPISLSVRLLPLIILIPSVESPKGALRSAWISVILASLLLISTVVMVVVSIGPYSGHRSFFPLFKAVRSVEVSEFLERVEIFTIFAWGFGLFISLSTYLYCGARGIQQLASTKSYKPLLAPMAVIWVVMSIHAFKDTFEFNSYKQLHISGFYNISLILIPAFLLWGGSFVNAIRCRLSQKKGEAR